MYEISKEFSFDASHQLPGHSGKCANVHGHTYRVVVTLSAEELLRDPSNEGFVLDFGDLKKIVAPLIDAMDHSFISSGTETILEDMVKHGAKVYYLGLRSTAENIAHHICNHVNEQLTPGSNAKVSSVEVWETPKSKAVYRL